MPPNYDEIDPPPSYSTLFPGKIVEPESSTDGTASTQPSPTSNTDCIHENTNDINSTIVQSSSSSPSLPSSSAT